MQAQSGERASDALRQAIQDRQPLEIADIRDESSSAEEASTFRNGTAEINTRQQMIDALMLFTISHEISSLPATEIF